MIRDTVVTSDSLRLVLPRRSGMYYWRVTATDGFNATRASGGASRFRVTYLPPVMARADREREEQPVLQQNFPNPFNPSTSISFTLQRAGHVRLAVFNLLGQEVAVLLDGVRPEGPHTYEFVNVDLPSGIYFYRLQAPGLFETKKMVIAK
jgi:hypothetical protein